ncbi:MAG: tetratricopeptide repeat protein [Nitrospirae bacterium]|nr:tetratricopeptide repeat protein [Nitrospirota bacterium]
MPKAIKKKIEPIKKKEDIQTVLTKARAFFTMEKKYRLIAFSVVSLIVLVLVGFLYLRNKERNAEELFYEGYKLYYGLYQRQPQSQVERLSKALDSFKSAYKAKGSALSLYYIANCYYGLQKYDDAISSLRELNQRFPDDERFVPLTYYKMSMASLKKGNKEEALKYLEILYNYKGIAYDDIALMESANILDEMGKTKEAKEKYEQVIKDFSWSPLSEQAKARLKKG